VLSLYPRAPYALAQAGGGGRRGRRFRDPSGFSSSSASGSSNGSSNSSVTGGLGLVGEAAKLDAKLAAMGGEEAAAEAAHLRFALERFLAAVRTHLPAALGAGSYGPPIG